ncbi:MAG: peptidoglycan-associated lipoprotein Pal [Rhodobacteraceae bacterium]|nr:peptidoglycan-associated lipoprotein Pal [Paracoccaceae bacterium]
MTLRLAALLISGALVLAGCAGAPNDNMRNTGSDNTGVYQQDSPEFFVHQVGDRVHFAVDQSTLSAEAMSILDAQAAWLGQNGEFSALIEGHADEQGTREYNLALGARRAAAAKDYLVSKGVAGGRLRTISYGKERPIEICSTEDCWSRNRRAVTVVSAGSS